MTQSPVLEFWLFLILLAAIGLVVWYSIRIKQRRARANVYLEALECLVDGQEALAIQKLKEAVREDSENVAAYLRLGDVLRKKNMVKHAIRIHKDLTFRGNLTPELKRKVYESLLQDYEAVYDVDNAIQVARKLLQLNKKNNQWVVQKLVGLLERKGAWVEALEMTRKYLNTGTDAVKHRMALYHVFQGLELVKQDRGKEARVKFKEALKVDPNCAAAYYYLGKSYVEEDRLEDAIREWKKLCYTVPSRAYIVFGDLEKACFEQGVFNEVEKIYLELLNVNAGNYKAGLSLAEIYVKKGDFDAALDILGRLSDTEVEPDLLQAYRVRILFSRGQYKQAATQAVEFLEKKYHLTTPVFECQVCHFESREPLWVCPQCKNIGSFNL